MKIFYQSSKRLFDIVASVLGLIVLWPLLIGVALIVRLDSSGPSLFKHERVGKGYRRFKLLKFRTMLDGNDGAEITCGAEARITRVGSFLRRFKLDELPQLWNVLRGDMSLVGPRPEVARFVEQFPREYDDILQVRPGLTDPSSIRYRSEAEILDGLDDPLNYYETVILPDKLSISREYVRSANIGKDLKCILATLTAVFRPDRTRPRPIANADPSHRA